MNKNRDFFGLIFAKFFASFRQKMTNEMSICVHFARFQPILNFYHLGKKLFSERSPQNFTDKNQEIRRWAKKILVFTPSSALKTTPF